MTRTSIVAHLPARRVGVLVALCLLLFLPANAQKIGLALSGGGAKGAAEVGVLKVLEEAGLHVDYIAGTSIGAIVGGLYAAGYSATELEQMFCQQEWLSLLTDRHEKYSGDPYKTVEGITYIFGFPVIDRTMRPSACCAEAKWRICSTRCLLSRASASSTS